MDIKEKIRTGKLKKFIKRIFSLSNGSKNEGMTSSQPPTSEINNCDYHREKLFKTVLASDQKHRDYLDEQLNRTLQKKENSSAKRVEYMLGKLTEKKNCPNDIKIISIGCRNKYEIDAFRNTGFHNIIGIDLYSEDPSINVMDMHNMTFMDNTFDLVYSTHSLEHSNMPEKAIREFIRIGKKDATFIIEVPVNYKPQGSDHIDFISLDNLYNVIRSNVNINIVYFEEQLKKGDENNFCGTDIVRTIFEVSK